jgi:hypothetical protein
MYKNIKTPVQSSKTDKTLSGISRIKPQPIKTVNLTHSTIGNKGFLSPGRNREL